MAKKKDQGYTMIIVMCLMFLFMALALSMLFSSALLLARAERAAAQKQSRASAISFTEWMEAELREGSKYSGEDPNNLPAQIQERLKNGWRAYTGGIGYEESVAVLVFTPMDENATSTFPRDKFGDVEVRMYWEAEDGGTDPKGEDTNLVVTVKVVVRGEQYSVTTRYEKGGLDETTDPEDPWKGWTGKWNVVGRE